MRTDAGAVKAAGRPPEVKSMGGAPEAEPQIEEIRAARKLAARLALLYVGLGALWVALTDLVVETWLDGSAALIVRTVEGVVFVAGTGAAIYLGVRNLGIGDARARAAEEQLRTRSETLARSQERYRRLVELLPGVVWLNEVDRDDPKETHCVYVGPQLEDLLGYAPSEWMDDDDLWSQVIHPDDRPGVLLANDAADETGVLSVEYRALARDGRTVWIHDEAVHIPGDRHHPGYWQGIMVDITPQRAADAGLQELGESLRGLFTASPVAIITLEPDGRVRHWNPAAERMFGWSAGEVVGKPLPIVPEGDRNGHRELLTRSLDGSPIRGQELLRQRRDGTMLEVTLWTAPLKDADGKVDGVMGVMEDVTERKRVANELALQAEILGHVNDAVIVTDESFSITFWNRGAQQLYGWSAEEAVGRDVTQLLRADLPDRTWEQMREAFLRDGWWRQEIEHPRKDGTWVPVDVFTVAWTRDDGQVSYLSVNRDVRERRAAEEALARRTRQQEAIAGFGVTALETDHLEALLEDAVALVAQTLGIDLVGVLELQPDGETLLLSAGVGWREGLVGTHAVARGSRTLSGYAFDAGEPVIADDIRSDDRFAVTPELIEHGVVSAMATVVYSGRTPSGVLSTLSTRERAFTKDDVRFLQGVAAIVGLAMERDRATSALREAEVKYRTLVEEGPAIVYLYPVDRVPANLTYISPQVVDLLGYPYEAWTSDPEFWVQTVHPEDRPRVLEADRRSIERNETFDQEYRFVAADGREVWVHDRSGAVLGGGGELLFRQGALFDVTDRRRAQEERRRAVDRQLRLTTRLEILHELDRSLQSAASIEDMSALALDRLRQLIAFDRGSVGLLDAPDRLRLIAVVDDGTGPRTGEVLPIHPELGLRTRDAAVEFIDLSSQAPEVSSLRWATDAGYAYVMTVPLSLEAGVMGWVRMFSRAEEPFAEEDQDVATEVAAALAIAISQTRLRDDLRERADELERLAEERRQMLHRIVRAQEEERERVALELHDGLGQVLTSISLFASNLYEEVPEPVKPRVQRVNDLVRRAIVDGRQLVWSLRPPELERLGLVPALRRLVEDAAGREVTLDLHEDIGGLRLEPEAEAVVYRVVQEAVNNAQKHADASAISILLRRRNGALTTLVEDDGRGFDPDAIAPGRGLGLVGMRERAELVSGELVIESASGAGTRIRLEVPIGEGSSA